MKIAVAADHAGYALKQSVIDELKAAGREVIYLGTHDATQPDDYPDFAALVCEAVRRSEAERGVILCGSGVGVVITANKFPGIRAGLCHDSYSAHQGVEHEDMNVLCLGARIIGSEIAREIVRNFATARYSAEDQHARRLEKINQIEAHFLKKP